jgi:CRISPR system Cascade subunit CasB
VTERHPFIERLQSLAKGGDRAALARLRRGFNHPMAAMPYVAPFLRRGASRREEDALLLVGALFGLHPSEGGVPLATAMRRLAETSDSVELRFRALLDADPEDVGTHLRQAVSLVRSHDIPIDYDDLLQKLLSWGRDDRAAQRAWARLFWGAAPSELPSDMETPQ